MQEWVALLIGIIRRYLGIRMSVLLVAARIGAGPESPKRWLPGQIVGVFPDDHEFGTDEVPETGKFYLVYITNRTEAQTKQYMQTWKHNPTTTQVSNEGNVRLLEVVSDMVSVSGKNAFTQTGVDDFINSLNETYPTANAEYFSHTNTSFSFYVTVPLAQRDALIDLINGAVHRMQYARTRWYINQAGLDYLANNNGVVSGPATQVSNYLRDGLLD